MRARLPGIASSLALMSALAAGRGEAAEAVSKLDPATRSLQREVAQLRREREISAGKSFYLRLDAVEQRLALMLQGIPLDDYATSGLEVGVPEILFFDRRPRADWDTRPISRGRLEPERQRDRLEVLAPVPSAAPAAEASPSPPPVPKSAEEAYSVPSPYRIVFAEGISLEVISRGEGRRNRGFARRLGDAIGLRLSDLGTALGFASKDRVRLRVTLEAEDAASLYRSLPPDVELVVAGLKAR
jgi:hypothetical protein